MPGEASENQEPLSEDAEIDKRLQRINEATKGHRDSEGGHRDSEGKISNPKNRKMEILNQVNAIKMGPYFFKDEERISEFQRKGLEILRENFPDQVDVLRETLTGIDELKKYASGDESIFKSEKE